MTLLSECSLLFPEADKTTQFCFLSQGVATLEVTFTVHLSSVLNYMPSMNVVSNVMLYAEVDRRFLK